MMLNFVDYAVFKKTALSAAILATLGLAVAMLVDAPNAFILGVALGAGLCIGLFVLFTYIAHQYWNNHKDAQSDVSLGPIMLLSVLKILALGALLFVCVYSFGLDPLGLILGVSSFYISLAFVPFFSKPSSSEGTGEDVGKNLP